MGTGKSLFDGITNVGRFRDEEEYRGDEYAKEDGADTECPFPTNILELLLESWPSIRTLLCRLEIINSLRRYTH
jgi:hypothetical protein